MVRFRLLAGCWCGMFLVNVVAAMEPVTPPTDAVRAYEEQRSHARQMIQQRAAKEQRDRVVRIEARKRAGISLQRPVKARPWYK